jgi:hypothetical protein
VYLKISLESLQVLIWIAGLVFVLRKRKQYHHMSVGALGCLGMALYSLVMLILALPQALLATSERLAFFRSQIFSFWESCQLQSWDTLVVVVSQIFVVWAIAGRCRCKELAESRAREKKVEPAVQPKTEPAKETVKSQPQPALEKSYILTLVGNKEKLSSENVGSQTSYVLRRMTPVASTEDAHALKASASPLVAVAPSEDYSLKSVAEIRQGSAHNPLVVATAASVTHDYMLQPTVGVLPTSQNLVVVVAEPEADYALKPPEAIKDEG